MRFPATMASAPSFALFSASSGARKANTKYSTNCAKTTTGPSDLMAEPHRIQVSDSNVRNLWSLVVLDNGDEINLLPYGIQKEFSTKCLVGNGVIVDPKVLLDDFHGLTRNGIDYEQKTLISQR